MEQAGGEPAKHSNAQVRQVDVLGFRISAWEHVSYSVAKERSCHIPFVEGTSGRVSPAGPDRLFLVNRPGSDVLSVHGLIGLSPPESFGEVVSQKWPNGGPSNWVRTLPLSRVVTVSGRIPRIRVLAITTRVIYGTRFRVLRSPHRLGIYGHAPNDSLCISSGISKPSPTPSISDTTSPSSTFLTLSSIFVAAIVVGALSWYCRSGLRVVTFFLP
ncbi:hypothetical protein PIB30_006371 [Stylosanthes scabra]|uniref:Uncharacterized protein n=1 Tax=Stylosanthes scabra TaxID=79078 RepID=A0ABU6S4T8_9FABA|nr:hypothetical protein [Stylosanthes scabra]